MHYSSAKLVFKYGTKSCRKNLGWIKLCFMGRLTCNFARGSQLFYLKSKTSDMWDKKPVRGWTKLIISTPSSGPGPEGGKEVVQKSRTSISAIHHPIMWRKEQIVLQTIRSTNHLIKWGKWSIIELIRAKDDKISLLYCTKSLINKEGFVIMWSITSITKNRYH